MSSNSSTSAPVKLLSLDGGGVRGISSMVILREIMEKVKEEEQSKNVGNDSERLPCRYFDLAGGTSTGGLAAIMLFRLEMSVSDVIDQYESMATKIFSKKEDGPFFGEYEFSVTGLVRWLFNWFPQGFREWLFNNVFQLYYWIFVGLGGSFYSGQGLVDAVDEVAGKNGLWGRARLFDKSKPKMLIDVRLLFTTIQGLESKGVIRSYEPPNMDEGAPPGPLPRDFWKDITLEEAARATTSAPFYFPSKTFNKHVCVDGGLLNNNPVERVWDARHELATATGGSPHVSLIVSLGTAKGQAGPVATPADKQGWEALVEMLREFFTKPGTAWQRAQAILDLATNTEEPHRDFEQRMYYRNSVREEKTHYFRFNADVDEGIDLADVKGMKELRRKTEDWLLNQEVRDKVIECARCLAKSPEGSQIRQ